MTPLNTTQCALKLPAGKEVTTHTGDCLELMPQLPDRSVSVVVTSPPYNIGVEYGTCDDNLDRDQYLDWLRRVSQELWRVLADEGSLFLNVGAIPSDPWIAHDVAEVFRSDWTLQNDIAWAWSLYTGQKTVGQFKPLNSDRYLNRTWEHVFHFTKGGDISLERLAIGVPYEDKSNVHRFGRHGDLRCRGSVWVVPHETIQDRGDERGGHPATFPVELARMCLRLHGVDHIDCVLDPFLGSGSTLVAATELGLPALGVELDPYYAQFAKERIARAQSDRGSLLVPAVDQAGSGPMPTDGTSSAGRNSPQCRETETQEVRERTSPLEVNVLLGTDRLTGQALHWAPSSNQPRRLTNQHVLVLGKSGSGKTETVKSLIWELDAIGIPSIIFDYHGEYASGTFNDAVRPQVFDAMAGLPINPFELPLDPLTGRKRSPLEMVFRLADTLNSSFGGFGNAQLGLLRRGIEECYVRQGFDFQTTGTWDNEPPTLEMLSTVLDEWSDDSGSPVRSLQVRLQPLFRSGVFCQGTANYSYNDLLARTTVIVMTSGIRDLMFAASRFLLERIYSSMLMAGPTNQLRAMVCIDEAHKLCGDEAIVRLVKESRKYGLGLLLSSHELRDFHPSILANTGTVIALELEYANATEVSHQFGLHDKASQQTARDLIMTQGTGQALVRSQHFMPYAQVQVRPLEERVAQPVSMKVAAAPEAAFRESGAGANGSLCLTPATSSATSAEEDAMPVSYEVSAEPLHELQAYLLAWGRRTNFPVDISGLVETLVTTSPIADNVTESDAGDGLTVALMLTLPADIEDTIAQKAERMGKATGGTTCPSAVVDKAIRSFLGKEHYDRTHLMWESHRRRRKAA